MGTTVVREETEGFHSERRGNEEGGKKKKGMAEKKKGKKEMRVSAKD